MIKRLPVSASRRWLLRHCQAPFRGLMDIDESSGRAAAEGTAAHKALENYVDGVEEDVKVAKRLQDGVTDAKQWIDTLRSPFKLSAEVAYGLRLETGDSFVVNCQGRDYPMEDGVVYGTADLVADDSDVHAFVADWKTGKLSPATDDQMNMLAAMADVPHATVVYLGRGIHLDPVKVQPREQVIAELRADVAKIDEAFPNPGAWCTLGWCPARHACSAYQESQT